MVPCVGAKKGTTVFFTNFYYLSIFINLIMNSWRSNFFSKIFFLLHPWTWNQHLKFLLEIKWTFSFKRFENKNRLEVMKVEESRNMWHFFDPLSWECPLIQVSEAKGASECTRQPTVILCYLFKTLHRCSQAKNGWYLDRLVFPGADGVVAAPRALTFPV